MRSLCHGCPPPSSFMKKANTVERHPVQAWHYILCSYVLDSSKTTVSCWPVTSNKTKARPKKQGVLFGGFADFGTGDLTGFTAAPGHVSGHLLEEGRLQLPGVPEARPGRETAGLLQQLGHVGPEAQRILHRVLVLGKGGRGRPRRKWRSSARPAFSSASRISSSRSEVHSMVSHIDVGRNEPGLLLTGAGDHQGPAWSGRRRRNPPPHRGAQGGHMLRRSAAAAAEDTERLPPRSRRVEANPPAGSGTPPAFHRLRAGPHLAWQ